MGVLTVKRFKTRYVLTAFWTACALHVAYALYYRNGFGEAALTIALVPVFFGLATFSPRWNGRGRIFVQRLRAMIGITCGITLGLLPWYTIYVVLGRPESTVTENVLLAMYLIAFAIALWVSEYFGKLAMQLARLLARCSLEFASNSLHADWNALGREEHSKFHLVVAKHVLRHWSGLLFGLAVAIMLGLVMLASAIGTGTFLVLCLVFLSLMEWLNRCIRDAEPYVEEVYAGEYAI
jgi:hypothetical protein